MKKITMLFTLMVMLISTSALAFLVPERTCAVNGKVLSSVISGKRVVSDIVECGEESGVCSTMLTFYIETDKDSNTWSILDIPFVCDGDVVYIDDTQCFIKSGALYCPVIGSEGVVSFKANGDTYNYPEDVPIFKLNLD